MSSRKLGNGRVVSNDEREMLISGNITDNARIDTLGMVSSLANWFAQHPARICYQSVDDAKGTWLYWTSKYWQAYESADVFKQDIDWLCCHRVSDNQLKSMIESLQTRLTIPVGRFNHKPVVVFQDAALEATPAGIAVYKPGFQPDDLITLGVPVALKGKSDTTNWQTMLDMVLPDQEDQTCLAEMMGYCFFPAIQLECFFTLVGDAFTGKSTVLDVLRDMLGKDKISAVPLAALHERFALAQMVNSLINIDEEASYLDASAEGKLKAITGGGTVLIEDKYKTAYSATLPTKMVLATNEMPRVNDRSNGVWSRVVIIPFDHQIPPNVRKTKREILATFRHEHTGILQWALAAAMKAMKRGTRNTAFTQSGRAKELLAEHRRFSDPFLAWWDERIAVDTAAKPVPKKVLFDNYKDWCDDFGYKHTAHGVFGKRMLRMPAVGDCKPHDGARCYAGIRLKEATRSEKAYTEIQPTSM